MKEFRFCALCLILAALLSACGRQAAQDAPGAAAVPSPAAVPEAPAESTSTPSHTAPAEIGKAFDDLSFLNEEQRQAYEGAYKLNYTLYGMPDNLVWVDVSPRFTQQSDSEGVFVLTVGNYALYENPYTDFTNLMQSVFTTDFIRRLGPLYTEKFIDLDGHLAASCDSVLAYPMHDDLSRTVMDNCPDTYRLESVTDDTVVFALISHYDRNWANSFAPDDMDVYTIEYPIRLVRTADGWRVDEFHRENCHPGHSGLCHRRYRQPSLPPGCAGWTCLGHKHLHHHNGAGGRRLAVCTV